MAHSFDRSIGAKSHQRFRPVQPDERMLLVQPVDTGHGIALFDRE